MSATITRDEWLKAVTEADEPVDPLSVTAAELGEWLGISRRAASEKIAAMVRSGRAVRAFKLVDTSDGRKLRVRSYRLSKGKAK